MSNSISNTTIEVKITDGNLPISSVKLSFNDNHYSIQNKLRKLSLNMISPKKLNLMTEKLHDTVRMLRETEELQSDRFHFNTSNLEKSHQNSRQQSVKKLVEVRRSAKEKEVKMIDIPKTPRSRVNYTNTNSKKLLTKASNQSHRKSIQEIKSNLKAKFLVNHIKEKINKDKLDKYEKKKDQSFFTPSLKVKKTVTKTIKFNETTKTSRNIKMPTVTLDGGKTTSKHEDSFNPRYIKTDTSVDTSGSFPAAKVTMSDLEVISLATKRVFEKENDKYRKLFLLNNLKQTRAACFTILSNKKKDTSTRSILHLDYNNYMKIYQKRNSLMSSTSDLFPNIPINNNFFANNDHKAPSPKYLDIYLNKEISKVLKESSSKSNYQPKYGQSRKGFMISPLKFDQLKVQEGKASSRSSRQIKARKDSMYKTITSAHTNFISCNKMLTLKDSNMKKSDFELKKMKAELII